MSGNELGGGTVLGLIYSGICNSCGYRKDYKLNENTEVFKEKINDREKLIHRLDGTNKERLEQLISYNERLKKYMFKNTENGFHIEFSYKVYKCDTCNYFENKPYMEIKFNGKKLFETEYNCKNCGRTLTIDENAFIEAELYNKCPECCEKKYMIKPKDTWD
jgi:DNA-directed RNA polymerase subunit RPC12/RpoP